MSGCCFDWREAPQRLLPPPRTGVERLKEQGNKLGLPFERRHCHPWRTKWASVRKDLLTKLWAQVVWGSSGYSEYFKEARNRLLLPVKTRLSTNTQRSGLPQHCQELVVLVGMPAHGAAQGRGWRGGKGVGHARARWLKLVKRGSQILSFEYRKIWQWSLRANMLLLTCIKFFVTLA